MTTKISNYSEENLEIHHHATFGFNSSKGYGFAAYFKKCKLAYHTCYVVS